MIARNIAISTCSRGIYAKTFTWKIRWKLKRRRVSNYYMIDRKIDTHFFVHNIKEYLLDYFNAHVHVLITEL